MADNDQTVAEEPQAEEPVDEAPPVAEPTVEEPSPASAAPAAPAGDATPSGTDPQGRQLFDTVCAECGKQTQVPFKPAGDRPVYCRDCYMKRKGGGR